MPLFKQVWPALFLVVTAMAIAGQKSATKKQKPEEGFVIAPLVFKDAACVRDYLKAQTAGGLGGRKTLAELVEYGCVRKIEGIYHVDVRDTKPITSSGPKPSLAKSVVLILDEENTSKITRRGVDHDTTPVFAEGWILADGILHITEQKLDELVAKRVQDGSPK